MTGTLFLIPVSLGSANWQEYLPAAAHQITIDLSHFIVENAKTARLELKKLGHPLPVREIHIEQIPESLSGRDMDRLIAPLLDGQDVGLMSEAGCPGVADPGALLVRRAHELSIPVRPLIGPSSLLLALMGSGLDGQRFAFHGYLPAREPERSRRIVELEQESRARSQTQMFIEAPYRNAALLDALLAACRADTRLCVASDLTLNTEEISTRTVEAWRRQPRPQVDRRPTVFLFLSASQNGRLR